MLLLFLLYLVNAQNVCQVRLILNDLGADGWEDNYVTATANGVPINFESLDAAASVTGGKATLLEQEVGSFRAQIPAGASVDIQYVGNSTQFPGENSWVLELWDIINPFGAVHLQQSLLREGADGVMKPFAAATEPVVCGPKPEPVKNLRVLKTDQHYVSTISWDQDPSHANALFTVTYVSSLNPKVIVYLGITDKSSLNVILPTKLKLKVSVEALNQFGASSLVTSEEFTAGEYRYGILYLRLYDSDGGGWGPNDGSVTVTLNDYPFYTATFECVTEGGCHSTDAALYIPGVAWVVKTNFTPPSKEWEECSYSVHRIDGITLFESGQDGGGPVNPVGVINVFFDDGCPTSDPWGACVADNGVCGAGHEFRMVYKSKPDTNLCDKEEQKQECIVPCPVDCVGNWGGWSDCTAQCGVGYRARAYTVTTSPLNGGKSCERYHGDIETAQCLDIQPCEQTCKYLFEAFDHEQAGWGASYVELFIGNTANPAQRISFPNTTAADFTDSLKKTYFSAPRDAKVTFKWYPVATEGHVPGSAAFSVSQVVADRVLKLPVFQNPRDLDLSKAPDVESSFTASCTDCAQATPGTCAALNRDQCEFSQVADNTCGKCAEGYTSSVETKKSGNTPCTDIDECADANPCVLRNAKCRNTPGNFICYCTDPSVHTTKQCPVVADAASGGISFMEMATVLKQSDEVKNLPPNCPKCPGIITRKEWTELTKIEKQKWVQAIKSLFTLKIKQTLDGECTKIYNLSQIGDRNDPGYRNETGSEVAKKNKISLDTLKHLNQGAAKFGDPNMNDLLVTELCIARSEGKKVEMSFFQWTRRLHKAAATGLSDVHNNNTLFLHWHRQFLDDYEGYIRTQSNSCVSLPFIDSSRLYLGGKTDLFDGDNLCKTDSLYFLWNATECGLKDIPGCSKEFDDFYGCLPYPDEPAQVADPGPLWRDGNLTNLTTLQASSPTVYLKMMRYANVSDFSVVLESAHGAFHSYIGGHMGDFATAAGDPLFFMHHCFIDAVWAMYQECGSNGKTPVNDVKDLRVWSGKASDYHKAMPNIHKVTPSQVFSITELGYRYSGSFVEKLRTFAEDVGWCKFDSKKYASKDKNGWRADVTPKTAPMEAGAVASYKEYRGFYKRANKGSNTTDLYSSHGGHKKRKGKKAHKEPKEIRNWKKLNRAYKEAFKKTQNAAMALEAMELLECTIHKPSGPFMYNPLQIKTMKRQRMCAEGWCNNKCWDLTKGLNAKKRTKRYKQKHGEWPADYVKCLNETLGSVPSGIASVLLEDISVPNRQPSHSRLQGRNHQAFINP